MRTAVVLWFYTEEQEPVAFEPARFVSRPDAGLINRGMVRLESELFGLYHRAKRRFRITNRTALSLMRLLGYDRVAGGG